MPGKQAKTLTPMQLRAALRQVRRHRRPKRDRVMLLLSLKAGLRAGEIAGLTWAMVLTSTGTLGIADGAGARAIETFAGGSPSRVAIA